MTSAQGTPDKCSDLRKIFTDSVSNKELSEQALGTFNTRLCTASDFLLFFINLIFVFSGGIAVLMIVYGGFRYVVSGGEASGTEAGKKTLTYAVAGLAVILLAFAIVNIATRLLTQPTVPVSGNNNGNNLGNTGIDNNGTVKKSDFTKFVGTLTCRTIPKSAAETSKTTNTCPERLFRLDDGSSPPLYDNFDMEVSISKEDSGYILDIIGFLHPKTLSCVRATRNGGILNDCPEKYKPRRIKIASTLDSSTQYLPLTPCTTDPDELKARPGTDKNEKCKKVVEYFNFDISTLTKDTVRKLNSEIGIQDDSAIYVYLTVESPVLDNAGNVKSWKDDAFTISPGLMKFSLQ